LQPLNLSWIPEPIVTKSRMYVYHAIWDQFSGIHHTSLPSVIRPCSPSNCWDDNINIVRMPEPIIVTPRTHIMRPEAIWTTYFINPSRQYQHCKLSNF
jgi:hypothetical protein